MNVDLDQSPNRRAQVSRRRSYQLKAVASALALLALMAARPCPAAAATRVVYIGTYTGEASKGIYAYRFDDGSGALTPIGLVAETPSPSFIIASEDGRFVFAVNELQKYAGTASGSVTSFAVDKATSKLTQLSVQATQGASPCHLALDRTGRYLAVANYSGGNFALFPVGKDGRLQPAATVFAGDAPEASGPKPPARLGHAVFFTSDNKFLIAADKGADRILVYHFDQATGKLTPAKPPFAALPAGSGPRHFVFHPNGRWVFAITEQGATINTLAWDARTGGLTAMASVSTTPAGVKTDSTAEIAVHPSGRFVYGSNRGHDSVAVFAVGADGALTPVEYESTRGQTPRNFALDPKGRWLIAANQRSGTLAVFSVDEKTGALSPLPALTSVGAPSCVLFMNN
jgi:6-phosphogluconolactonase